METDNQRLIDHRRGRLVYLAIVYPEWLTGFVHGCWPADLGRYREHFGDTVHEVYGNRREAAEALKAELKKLAVPGARARADWSIAHHSKTGTDRVTNFALATEGCETTYNMDCFEDERPWFIRDMSKDILGEYELVEHAYEIMMVELERATVIKTGARDAHRLLKAQMEP
jgi:hypothetical protein